MTQLAQTQDALSRFQLELEGELSQWVDAADERGLDPLWQQSRTLVREFALRPAKRVRPTLVALGWMLAKGHASWSDVPREVVQFGVGLELLHTFMLIHDDVADRAQARRGGAALHKLLGAGRLGEDLAVVSGDHLYARAMEAMFSTPSPHAAAAGRYMLEVCRHTAAGQHLDLVLTLAPLSEVTLFRTLKVADLKTARYGFVAPLACGAMLGGADRGVLEQVRRVGRHAGLAYQLRDDLIGLCGDDAVAGKGGGADYLEGKRTFPVIAAWTRADAAGRAHLESLWNEPQDVLLPAARAAVGFWGGISSTQRVVEVRTRAARKALEGLGSSPAAAFLDEMLTKLTRRAS
jgi:geranylgeranyl diphosphate synthase, type I